jgi:hypothetical protein
MPTELQMLYRVELDGKVIVDDQPIRFRKASVMINFTIRPRAVRFPWLRGHAHFVYVLSPHLSVNFPYTKIKPKIYSMIAQSV